jgi:hypothetical protein
VLQIDFDFHENNIFDIPHYATVHGLQRIIAKEIHRGSVSPLEVLLYKGRPPPGPDYTINPGSSLARTSTAGGDSEGASKPEAYSNEILTFDDESDVYTVKLSRAYPELNEIVLSRHDSLDVVTEKLEEMNTDSGLSLKSKTYSQYWSKDLINTQKSVTLSSTHTKSTINFMKPVAQKGFDYVIYYDIRLYTKIIPLALNTAKINLVDSMLAEKAKKLDDQRISRVEKLELPNLSRMESVRRSRVKAMRERGDSIYSDPFKTPRVSTLGGHNPISFPSITVRSPFKNNKRKHHDLFHCQEPDTILFQQPTLTDAACSLYKFDRQNPVLMLETWKIKH